MAFIFKIFCMLSSSYSYLQSSALFAPPGRRASRHRRYLLNQRSPTSAGRAACPCAPSFRDSPRHSCCGLIASFPGHCVLCPEDACPKRFSWFFYWIPKVPKALFMVFQLDSKGAEVCKFCRSRQELSPFEPDSYSNEYLLPVFTCKIWRRYSRERASQSLPKISQELEKS